jgi:hypothetical protein
MRAIAPLLLRSLDHLRPPAKANKQPFHHPDDPSPLDALVLQAAQQRQSRVDLRLHAAVRRRLRQHVGARRAYPLPHQPRRVQASAGRAAADLRDDRTIRVTRQLIVLSGEQQVSDSFLSGFFFSPAAAPRGGLRAALDQTRRRGDQRLAGARPCRLSALPGTTPRKPVRWKPIV